MSVPLHWKTEPLRNNCLKTGSLLHAYAHFMYVDVSSVSNESFRIIDTKTLLGREAPSRARKQMKAGDDPTCYPRMA